MSEIKELELLYFKDLLNTLKAREYEMLEAKLVAAIEAMELRREL